MDAAEALFLSLAYSIFPDVVVDRMAIWDAASHTSALQFMLWGAAIVLPCIAGYTVFRNVCPAARCARPYIRDPAHYSLFCQPFDWQSKHTFDVRIVSAGFQGDRHIGV